MTTAPPRPAAGAPANTPAEREAIAWLLAERENPHLAPAQRQAFDDWLAAPENAHAYARVLGLTADFRAAIDHPDFAHKRQALYDGIRARRRRRWRLYAAAAAAVAVIAGASQLPAEKWPRFPWEKPVERMFATAVGQRSTIPLEDGSVITLDTASTVHVTFGQDRAVKLESGQALFHVAKGDKRPFVVYAGDRRVVATGTSFDVRTNGGVVEVTLIEGHVKVGGAAQGVPAMTVDLQAGEKLVAKVGGAMAVTAADLTTVTDWTAGKHIFKDVTLGDAITAVNRYTDKPVTLADPALGALHVSGVFRTGNPEEFARGLAAINNLTIGYRADGGIQLSGPAK